MATLTFQDVGACNCSSCPTGPCLLPNGGINCAISGSIDFTSVPGGTTTQISGNCATGWTTACVNVAGGGGAGAIIFDISVAGSVITYRVRAWVGATVCTGAPTATFQYASDGSVTTLTLVSFNCTTRTIVFNAHSGGGAFLNLTFTLTW